MATTSKQTKTRARAERTLCYTRLSITTGVLAITTEREGRELYFVAERPSDVGRSFDLEKMSGTARVGATYRCDVGPLGQNACGCKGNAVRSVCRHVAALQTCLRLGKIEGGIPGAGECDEAAE